MTQISTYMLYQNTIQNAIRVQSNISDIQQQVSSGNKSSDFAGLGTQAGVYINLQNQLSNADAYGKNNTVLQAQLNTTSTALGQIATIANKVQNLILQARNSSEAGSLAFDTQLNGYFQTIAQQLNTQSNGQYLFSGTRTDTAAVDPTQFPTNSTLGVPDAGYYKGSNQDITATISDNLNITANVRADDSGFQQIMAGLATAKAGFAQGDDSLLAQAYTLVQQGVARVTQLQTTVNANSQLISQETTITNAQTTYWNSLKQNTTNADLVSLSTQLATDQSVLQASFQIFARINSLHLTNYLTNG